MTTAAENMESSIKAFRFVAETQAGTEKQEMRNKIKKMGVILLLCFLLLNFVLVVVVMNRTSKLSSTSSTLNFSAVVNQTHETGEIVDEMEFKLRGIKKWINSTEEKFEGHQIQIQALLNQTKIDKKLKALENKNGELKKSHEELKEQFESLSQKLNHLENPRPIKSCSDAMDLLPSPRSQKQTIYPHGNGTSLEVLCDFETDGGGWTIIQKRTSGPKQEFQKNWSEYQNGFGSLNGNFWLGLENIHALTKKGDQELRIQLEDFELNKRWAKYSNFSVSDASDFYRWSIGGFNINSTAGDSTHYQNGSRFSTKDKDNVNYADKNWSVEYGGGGGWWFKSYSHANLNGLYFEKGETVPFIMGVYWYEWKGPEYSLAKSEMKIRTRK